MHFTIGGTSLIIFDCHLLTDVTLAVHDKAPWAVLIVTPVMKRAHKIYWSSTVVFIDTSASCDSTSANVTIILTATKAGAVPLAVLIHEGQSSESYEVALSLA